jgi:hypothetical protein
MSKLSTSAQLFIWVTFASVLVLLSALPLFDKVAETLRYFAATIFGGVMVTKPGDAPAPLVDIVTKVAASLSPPPPPPSSPSL